MTAVHSLVANSVRKPVRKIVLARAVGFCFGVRRAVQIALQERKSHPEGRITTLGPVVHNEQVSADMHQKGIGCAPTLSEIEQGTVVMSAHGIAPAVRRDAERRGLKIVDVTCPFVTKLHRSALELASKNYQVVLVGDPGHTEVKGVMGALADVGATASVIASVDELAEIPLGKKVGIVSQTTQYATLFAAVTAAVTLRASDVRALNTVCGATEELQDAAIEMAKTVDVAIVVGGKQSANTRRLRELCAAQGIPAYHIETADEIDLRWIEGAEVIGITAGASTPDAEIEKVARCLNSGELPQDWMLTHPE
jgi:4-hydroxy-3-methylbut-2-en-1-yl diphosphate reductase